MKRLVLFLFALSLTFLSTSCIGVSKRAYDEVVAERDAALAEITSLQTELEIYKNFAIEAMGQTPQSFQDDLDALGDLVGDYKNSVDQLKDAIVHDIGNAVSEAFPDSHTIGFLENSDTLEILMWDPLGLLTAELARLGDEESNEKWELFLQFCSALYANCDKYLDAYYVNDDYSIAIKYLNAVVREQTLAEFVDGVMIYDIVKSTDEILFK